MAFADFLDCELTPSGYESLVAIGYSFSIFQPAIGAKPARG